MQVRLNDMLQAIGFLLANFILIDVYVIVPRVSFIVFQLKLLGDKLNHFCLHSCHNLAAAVEFP